MTGWTPLGYIKYSKVHTPYLPLDKQNLANLSHHFQNVYPGDEFYIFEENNGKWGRGYVVSQSIPSDFSSAVINLNKLVEQKVTVAIVPLSHVQIIKTLELVQDITDKDDSRLDIPSILDSQIMSDALMGTDESLSNKHRRPFLPALEEGKGNIKAELKSASQFLTAHIYAMYSLGEFHLFNKLILLYNELEEVRVALAKGLCTKKEETHSRKRASLLLSRIPKFLAATEKLTRYDQEDKMRQASSDVSGYHAIMARSPDNGDLLSYAPIDSPVTPVNIAMNQLLYALSGSYPLNNIEASLDPKVPGIFDRSPPSNIMVNFEAVKGSTANVPKGYRGMTLYVYLRTKKKRLTEAFAINIGRDQEFLLENVSAALFKGIPPTEIDNGGKVFLVAMLAEEIDISHPSRYLKNMRQGIAAGVADISRVFSRHKGALTSGESHQFNIKLYGSFIDPQQEVENNGWGELIDRIISGSSVGIAINPRAESLSISVKEIKNKSLLNESFQTSHQTALTPIRSIVYDPLSKSNEKIYLRLNKVAISEQFRSYKKSYLSIQIYLSDPNHQIKKGSNQPDSNIWECVSVVPGETIGEVLSIGNLLPVTSSPTKETALFKICANGQLVLEGKFLFKEGSIITDTEYKDISINLRTLTDAQFGTLTFSTEYVGTVFNVDQSIDSVIRWQPNSADSSNRQDVLMSYCKDISKKGLQPLLRNFSPLLSSLLKIFEFAMIQKNDELVAAAFGTIVHVLDVVVGKNDQYRYIFDDYCNDFKDSTSGGAGLLLQASQLLSFAKSEWNQVGRQFCRVSLFIFKLGIVCNTTSERLARAVNLTNSSLIKFISLTDAKFLTEQEALLDNLNYYFEDIHKVCDDLAIWQFIVALFEKLGTRGLGLKEEGESILSKGSKSFIKQKSETSSITSNATSSVTIAKMKMEEHKLIICKIILIRKVLHSRLMHTSQSISILSGAINWSLEILLSSYDVDAARLAAGNLAVTFDFIWNTVVVSRLLNNWHLVRSITRLLPVLIKIFMKYNKYCKVQGEFYNRRTFKNLFQMEYPATENAIDSIVTTEVFVGLLVELSSLIAFATKFSKHCINIETGYDGIKTTTQDEEFLRGPYYTRKLSDSTVTSLIQYTKTIYDSQFFPADRWLSLSATLIESAFSILELLKWNMIHQFIPPSEESDKFNTSLWGNYLRAILKMTTSKPAATCQLARIPRAGCDMIVGDLRLRGAKLFEEVWFELGWDAVGEDVQRFNLNKFTGYQSEFLSSNYSVLKDLMLLFFQRHERCQVVGVKAFWSIIASECILNEEGLSEMAKESITGLYNIFNSDGYKPNIREIKAVVNLLKMTIKINPEDVAFSQISNFVTSLCDFMFILNDLTKVPYSDEFDDDRTFHKLNIMKFLLKVDQPELLYSFIDDLYQSNTAKNNFMQLALSLSLLADTLDWSLHTLLPPSERPYFPQQTPFKRKEALYRMIGHNLIKSNCLEQAVEIYSELRDAFDKVSLDLKGLSYANEKLAKLYKDLQNPDRIMPSYFKVSYIGSGFPETLQGRHFIHQGLPFEQLSSMQDRLSRLHPGSRILTQESELTKFKDTVPMGKYIYVNSVELGKGFDAQNSLVSYSARLYVQNKDLRHFVSFKRLPNATGIHDLYSEEVIYETFEQFPALMNRSEIKETDLKKLSPLENAYRLIVRKNHDLANLESLIETLVKDKEDTSHYFNELSRQVSGTVDSPVNGGVGQYRIFFGAEYMTNPKESNDVQKLKNAFNDLAIILNRCLEWHGKLLPTQKLKESHSELLKLFEQNFKPEIDELLLILRDTSDGVSISGYTDSIYSSEDENSTISRVRTNFSQTSSGSSELSSSISKNSLPQSNGKSSATSVHSGSNISLASKTSNGRRLPSWRQSKFV